MADNKLFRAPDENSGPAALGREPIVAPEARKSLLETAKDTLGMQ